MDEVVVQTFETSLPNCEIESLIIAADGVRALEPFIMKLGSGAHFVRIYIYIIDMKDVG
jgi:hypothetical protein